jgi:hypothetical protein
VGYPFQDSHGRGSKVKIGVSEDGHEDVSMDVAAGRVFEDGDIPEPTHLLLRGPCTRHRHSDNTRAVR